MEKSDRWIQFGLWLRGKREFLGLKQREATQRAGMATVQQWSRYENGAPASRAKVVTLAEALNVSREEALSVAGFVDVIESPSIKLTQVMLDAIASVYPMRPVKIQLLEWLSSVQSVLGFEMDLHLCVEILQKRKEEKGD